MKSSRHFMLTAVMGLGALLSVAPASATQVFEFKGERVLPDPDKFQIRLETEDALRTESYGAHTNVAAGLTSPAYTFTGYRITGISGSWFEEFAPSIALPITSLLPIGSIVENSPYNDPPGPDTSAHSPTDNLFNPDKGFAPPLAGAGGKFSYGGVAFVVDFSPLLSTFPAYTGPLTKEYQLYTDPDTLGYAGCPGSCIPVNEVPEPSALMLSLGATFVLPWMRRARSRNRMQNQSELQPCSADNLST